VLATTLLLEYNDRDLKLSIKKKLSIGVKPLNFSHNISTQTLFCLFEKQPWAMWLDSCQSQHIDSRYDIIVWQPLITLKTIGKSTEITFYDDEQSVINVENDPSDPFTLLKTHQQNFFSKYMIEPSTLPFVSGAVGYFSYDLGRRIEQLPEHAQKDIDIPEMAMGIYNHAIVFDNQDHCFYLVCPENDRSVTESYIFNLLENGNNEQLSFKLTLPWQTNLTKKDYIDKFNTIQSHLLEGDCYQINLTQRFSSHYQGDEFSAYLELKQSNQAPFSAFCRFNDHTILSISPERFLKLRGNKVQSKPIKGTKVRSTDAKTDAHNADILLNSIKDRAENLMIVDLLRNDISKVCRPGTVQVPHLFTIESFPAVHHLVSTVEGELSSTYDACDLLRASFPGGSITGAPKIRAMEIIDELEPHRRSIYCGSIGYISACGNMDSNITIRTLVCKNNDIYCWAGGGIVADSLVEDEYQESLDKVNKILPVLTQL